jgi:dihydroflavonol-4-reductase
MATTLVTGGTGFIGSHVVRELAGRGDELRLLVREGRDTAHLDHLEWERATGDVRDRDSVRRAMRGVERVFHIAGTTSMRRRDRDRVFEVNVTGTRNVMEEALRAGVLRAVFTSSSGAVGPAKPGGTADESQPFTAGGLGIAYVNAKHDAEGVAMRVAARGLPVVVVNPSFVFGPDDPTGTSNGLVRRLLLRRIPAYLDGALSIVDVRDVARGHLLADELGHEGERYLLSGRNFTLQRLFADLSRIAGVPPPPLRANGRLMLAWVEGLERAGLPAPGSSDEIRSGMQWWTYRNDKARSELGFQPRPHEETLEDTVRWQLDQLGDRASGNRVQDAALRVVGTAFRVPSRLVGRLGR